jgi:cysteine-rich repeat protein
MGLGRRLVWIVGLAGCFVDKGAGGSHTGAETSGETAGETTQASTGGVAADSTVGEPTTQVDPTTETTSDVETTTTTTTMGTTVPAMCGNGVVEGDETCDDGNAMGGDGCSVVCMFEAVCGDMQVGPGETCDDGNMMAGDGCGPTCLLEGCGDGVKQGRETCDDGNTVGGDGCSDQCVLDYLHVFVTKTGYSGALGGVLGADMVCQKEAEGLLPGAYRAWIATTEDDRPAIRFATSGGVPYRMRDGTQIVSDFSGLNNDIQHPIDQTASGESVMADNLGCSITRSVWTGLENDGHPVLNAVCAGWTSAEDGNSGHAGYLNNSNYEWTDACDATCSRMNRLYCFQQAP